MRSATRLRTVALALAAWTVLVGMSGPPCLDPATCPMDETAAAPTCDGMSSDCCQAAGERGPQAPAAPASAAVVVASGPAAAAMPTSPPPLHLPAGDPPPLAAVQGIGLYTLLAVFLI
ncbi:MAG TPA: hypothetical protein VGC93_08840 [Thermoanaerobaculia bacterium]